MDSTSSPINPIHVANVVDELREEAPRKSGHPDRDLMRRAAEMLDAQAAEIARLRACAEEAMIELDVAALALDGMPTPAGDRLRAALAPLDETPR